MYDKEVILYLFITTKVQLLQIPISKLTAEMKWNPGVNDLWTVIAYLKVILCIYILCMCIHTLHYTELCPTTLHYTTLCDIT